MIEIIYLINRYTSQFKCRGKVIHMRQNANDSSAVDLVISTTSNDDSVFSYTYSLVNPDSYTRTMINPNWELQQTCDMDDGEVVLLYKTNSL